MHLLGFLERRLTYKPDQRLYSDLSRLGFERRVLELSESESVDVRFRPGTSPYTVLFSHGNRANVTFYHWYYAVFAELGLGVVTYDYPGYGTSRGEPSEGVLIRSIDTVHRFVTSELGVDPIALVLFGLSLGGGPTIDLASRVSSRAVVAEATFTSTRAAGRYLMRGIPLDLLVPDRFPSIKKIASVTAPKLFIHGTNDRTIPLRCSEDLFAASRDPKYLYVIENGPHHEVGSVERPRYLSVMREFVEHLSVTVSVV